MAVRANSRPTAIVARPLCSGSSQKAQARPQKNGTKKLGKAICRLPGSSCRSTTSLRICPSNRQKATPYKGSSHTGASSSRAPKPSGVVHSISSGRPRVASSNWLTIGIRRRRLPSQVTRANSARSTNQASAMLIASAPG